MDWEIPGRVLFYVLAGLLVCPAGTLPGFAKANRDGRQTEEVKAAVRQIGLGKDARIMVNLRDGEKVGGYVQQTQEDQFSLSVFCSGNDLPVPFARVSGLRGLNLATGASVSAGKGVSGKATARLSAADPCGARNLPRKPPGPNPIWAWIALAAGLAAIFIPVGIAAARGD